MPKTLTKEEFAARLDGCEYRDDFSEELLDAARENDLVIIHGGSDDLVCFAGAITDETDVYGGGTILLCKTGIPSNRCKDDDCPYFHENIGEAVQSGAVRKLDVYWRGRCGDKKMDPLAYDLLGKPAWCYDAESLGGKFSTFDMFDTQDDEREYYCRAVVIDLNEIWPSCNDTQIVVKGGHTL